MTPWYVYILECSDKSLYTGITNNLEFRINKHVQGKGAKYTQSKGVKRLVYSEKHPDQSSALRREREIKSWDRQRKLTLVLRFTLIDTGYFTLNEKG